MLRRITVLALILSVQSHPLCLDDTYPSIENQASLSFCTALKDPQNKNGACCNRKQELAVKTTNFDTLKLSDECAAIHSEVICAECHPYAVHLFATGTGTVIMCPDFCEKYVAACGMELNFPRNYCDKMAADDFYCYPMSDALTSSTELVPYFPNLDGQLPNVPVGMYIVPESNTWWLIDQAGFVVAINNDSKTDKMKTVLDISKQCLMNGELGLLGLAFRPDFKKSKVFYVYYIDKGMKSVLSRFIYKNDLTETLNSEVRIIDFQQPYTNHNGGTLLFEPGAIKNPHDQKYFDLYVSTGDGGSANDPGNRSQNPKTYFGKILRFRLTTDIEEVKYTFPPGNIEGATFAYGLRNPWKCTFHRLKVSEPELWCGDVGQDFIEEIDHVVEGGNYGWRNYEGTLHNMDDANLKYIAPEYEYCHNNDPMPQCVGKTFTGQSITGGYWYTGTLQKDQYEGNYIFADFQQGSLHRMFLKKRKWVAEKIADLGFPISALAEDNKGELYVIKYGGDASMVYQIPDLDPNFVIDEPYEPGEVETPDPSKGQTPPGTNDSGFNDSDCPNNGLRNGNICCAFECGVCTDESKNCGWNNGGAGRCCIDTIANSGQYCKDTKNPPCIL